MARYNRNNPKKDMVKHIWSAWTVADIILLPLALYYKTEATIKVLR